MRKGSLIAALCIGALGALALAWGCRVYPGWTRGLLVRMDVSVGEVLKDRGVRLEQGGDVEGAKAAYRAALAGTFNGPEHRAEARERLGALLLREGAAAEAAALLRDASRGPHARPTARVLLGLAELLAAKGAYPESDASLLYYQAICGHPLPNVDRTNGLPPGESGSITDALKKIEKFVDTPS